MRFLCHIQFVRWVWALTCLSGSLLIPTSLSGQVQLSFFCELEGEEFAQLTTDSLLLTELRGMNVSIRMGLVDLSEARAKGVRRLEEFGIPVVAWLLPERGEESSFHAQNASQAIARYLDFQVWTERNHLLWAGIGLDLEPSASDVKLGQDQPLRMLGKTYLRLFQSDQLANDRQTYQDLRIEIQEDGYLLESYVIPLLYDEREAGSQSFQLMTGLVDLPNQREIPLCYSSTPGFAPAAILSYGREGDAVAIGQVGEGLSWEQLKRDLLLARQVSQHIHISNLEACLANGWLPRLKEFSFQEPVSLYSEEIKEQESRRSRIQGALRLLDYPILASVGIGIFLILASWILLRLASKLRRKSKGM